MSVQIHWNPFYGVPQGSILDLDLFPVYVYISKYKLDLEEFAERNLCYFLAVKQTSWHICLYGREVYITFLLFSAYLLAVKLTTI